MFMSHQKLNQEEEAESITLKKFLNKIEEEDKLHKKPKKYSLKIMEARKNKSPSFE